MEIVSANEKERTWAEREKENEQRGRVSEVRELEILTADEKRENARGRGTNKESGRQRYGDSEGRQWRYGESECGQRKERDNVCEKDIKVFTG